MAHAGILIVEDELITAADLEDTLVRLGYHVAGTASSGKEAIRRAEQARPDLILMDIRLKGPMDGTQAADEIHRRLGIPVVYLTAHADKETLSRAKLAEPLGYVVKPFQERELQAAIEIALHKSRIDARLRTREERLSATLGAIGEGVITLDGLGRILYMNPSAERWTGWRFEQARGRDLNEVFPLITRDDRQETVARDIVHHFVNRGYRGKGMVISIDKATAVRTYDKVRAHWQAYLEKLKAELAGSLLGAALKLR